MELFFATLSAMLIGVMIFPESAGRTLGKFINGFMEELRDDV